MTTQSRPVGFCGNPGRDMSQPVPHDHDGSSAAYAGPGQQPSPSQYGSPGQLGSSGQLAGVTPTNAKALIAFVTAFCFPILAIVFGVKARREIDRTGEAGRVYANWGLGLGIAWCVLIALYFVVVIGVVIAGIGGASSFAGI